MESRSRVKRAFTLMELMIVMAIMGLLAAITFPMFSRARENGRQATCNSNLRQIGMALQQYRRDEGRYPAYLRDMLPRDAMMDDGVSDVLVSVDGDYLGGTSAGLRCPSDTFKHPRARSSYGDLTVGVALDPSAERDGYDAGAPVTDVDPGRYVWNFWGYNNDGTAFQSPDEAETVNQDRLVDTTRAFNHKTQLSGYDPTKPANVLRFSLANRFPPENTIVTHCISHRKWSAANLNYPGAIYDDAAGGLGGRDNVLRLDGSVKFEDVSTWNGGSQWQNNPY